MTPGVGGAQLQAEAELARPPKRRPCLFGIISSRSAEALSGHRLGALSSSRGAAGPPRERLESRAESTAYLRPGFSKLIITDESLIPAKFGIA